MRSNSNYYMLTFLFVLYSCSLLFAQSGIRYFEDGTFDANDFLLRYEVVEFNDTIPNDTLFIREMPNGLIHSYYRKVNTGVCVDGECRKLDVILYWTVTGRYLGFELPEGEFLSKVDHIPFEEKDYLRLVEILNDPYSRLGQFTPEQLTIDMTDSLQYRGEPILNVHAVDGVSSATLPAVKEVTVDGAVYTSYTLWKYTYGETRNGLRKYTIDHLTEDLVIYILQSENRQDKQWALRNLGDMLNWDERLKEVFYDEILSRHDALTNEGIFIIPDSVLENNVFQLKLITGFKSFGYMEQRNILQKLQGLSIISPDVIACLAQTLPELNVDIINRIFSLFDKYELKEEVELSIMHLLDHENEIIAQKASDFLINHKIQRKKAD